MISSFSRAVAKTRRPTNASILPSKPGMYFWSEWNTIVEVYNKPRHKGLYVTPPGITGREIKITPFIAGTFKPQLEGKS